MRGWVDPDEIGGRCMAEVVRAMHKVVETHGLHDIRLDCGGCPAVE
jgi:hypothetical protein